jgi:hypothetical protein
VFKLRRTTFSSAMRCSKWLTRPDRLPLLLLLAALLLPLPVLLLSAPLPVLTLAAAITPVAKPAADAAAAALGVFGATGG